MADTMSPAERSRRMALIRSKDTIPEIVVRRLVHALGYRFRVHRKDLPGRPDLVFPARRKVIFVHGCFWHQHPGCRVAHVPATRPDYWRAKFAATAERDERTMASIAALGWEALIIWECSLRDREALSDTLRTFLGPTGPLTESKPRGGDEIDS